MSQPTSPYETQPPSARRLFLATTIALAAAALALVLLVLPAEYGIDPTGFGRATGLAAMHGPAKTFEIKDVVGGNDSYRNVAVPDAGEPVPLPNPAVHQDETQAYATRTVEIRLGREQETEMKTALRAGKMILYEWHRSRRGLHRLPRPRPRGRRRVLGSLQGAERRRRQQRLARCAVHGRARLVLAELQRLPRGHHAHGRRLLR